MASTVTQGGTLRLPNEAVIGRKMAAGGSSSLHRNRPDLAIYLILSVHESGMRGLFYSHRCDVCCPWSVVSRPVAQISGIQPVLPGPHSQPLTARVHSIELPIDTRCDRASSNNVLIFLMISRI